MTGPIDLKAAKQRLRKKKVSDQPIHDEALTLAFSTLHADDLRFCELFGHWFEWDDNRWRRDVTRRAPWLARSFARARIDDETLTVRDKAKVASARTVAAIVNLAKADPRHATAPDDWDADPWILNTPSGIVDLRTGELLPHDRSALCSKMTAAGPIRGHPCPLWRKVLDDVTNGDKDLQLYLQRISGYSLTGVTCEHEMYFLWGTGANGKGTFLNTVSGILGDYARIAPMATFTESMGDRHETELAMLHGARLVVAQETDEGRHWAEAKIKALTGGDPISARFMRQDHFTYQPQFKLLIAGNHKPSLRNVDEAMRRRLRLIPFTVCIPEGQRDPLLFEKLKPEWPGILDWMIDGCLMWQEDGMRPPAVVTDATAEYFESEDQLGQWLSECVTRASSPYDSVATSALYASWTECAKRSGITPQSKKSFSSELVNRGYERGHNEKGSVFKGASLKQPDHTEDPWWVP